MNLKATICRILGHHPTTIRHPANHMQPTQICTRCHTRLHAQPVDNTPVGSPMNLSPRPTTKGHTP